MTPSSSPSVLHLAFLLWIASLATQGATAIRGPWLSHVPVVYQANHDPAVVVLQDQRRLFVLYDQPGGLSWSQVNDWKPGRPLALAFSAETGPVLVDESSGRVLPVRAGWKQHPLEVYLDGLEGKDGSTAEMVDWSIKAAQHWQREMTRLHQMLLARASPEVRERLKEAQSRWQEFEESELALIAALDREETGTIGRVIAGSRRLSLVRDRTLHLYTYLD